MANHLYTLKEERSLRIKELDLKTQLLCLSFRREITRMEFQGFSGECGSD